MSIKEMELRKFVAPEMITGDGASKLVSRYLNHFNAVRPLIVTDKGVHQQPWFQEIMEEINKITSTWIIFDEITANPKDYEVMKGAELFLAKDCDLLIAIGGGSPMDAAKCISIVSTNGGNILEYEGVDQINLPGPPLICIPSTSGTAADISQFAIVNDTEIKVKKAIISKKVVPDLALIDPRMLMTMNPYLTACTGMDALTHAIEAYVSNAHSTLTDLHALEAIRLVNKNLEDAVKDERSLYTMYQMMIASSQAGLAFSNASLGAVHAMAHSMGGLLDLPHGECNSILLEFVIHINFDSCADRYRTIANTMEIDTSQLNDEEVCRHLMSRIAEIRNNIGIPDHVSVERLEDKTIERLIVSAMEDPCMITNPKELEAKEIGGIYETIIRSNQ